MAAPSAAEEPAAEGDTAVEEGAGGAAEESAAAHAECEDADEVEDGREAGQEPKVGLEDAECQQKNEKDKGNEEYEKGNYEEAVKAWARSLQSVRYILNKGFYQHSEEQQKEVHGMEIRLCLNMAQGYLKTKDWNNAVSHADKVLELDPSNSKALYRKASALMQLLSFKEAAAVLEKLLQVEPGNKAAKNLLNEARRKAEVGERKAKKMSQKMLSGIERDPRVPPTQREALVEFLRSTIFGTLNFVRSLPKQCRDLCSFASARRRGKALASSVWRWLEVGFLKGWLSSRGSASNEDKKDR